VRATENSTKRAVRERIWALLERERAAPPDVHGHIPAFFGAEAAAERLATLPVWRGAQVVKAVPDRAQLPVRARALEAGKVLYMAVPRLAHEKPFYLLDPANLTVAPLEAASADVAAHVAKSVSVEEMSPVDIVVCGSVAVNRQGVRLGKGAGYSDIEVALLGEAGLIGPQTMIITTVHHLQLVDEPLPETDHDFSVDVIVTTEDVICCPPSRRPPGILWDELSAETIAAIPVLAARERTRLDG
jgi:5-formyltetrahydrofolate cyclo-ligase